MAEEVQSLSDFAEAHPPRTSGTCWVCGIPEREELDQARNNGVTPSTMVRWLIEVKGYPASEATKSKIDYHLKSRHHLP